MHDIIILFINALQLLHFAITISYMNAVAIRFSFISAVKSFSKVTAEYSLLTIHNNKRPVLATKVGA